MLNARLRQISRCASGMAMFDDSSQNPWIEPDGSREKTRDLRRLTLGADPSGEGQVDNTTSCFYVFDEPELQKPWATFDPRTCQLRLRDFQSGSWTGWCSPAGSSGSGPTIAGRGADTSGTNPASRGRAEASGAYPITAALPPGGARLKRREWALLPVPHPGR